MIRRLLALAALAGVLVGGVLRLLGEVGAAEAVWAASTALLLVPLTWSVARTLWRRDVGVDVIALVAMAGALALGEELAGAVVALMLAGGNALEADAARPRAARADARCSSARRGSRTGAATARSRRCRSRASSPATSCSCEPAR